MTPHYSDDWLTVYGGDARTVLATLPEQSVHCVVTSPPYWGLRDYGTATWSGGDADCDHAKDRSVGIASSTLVGGKGSTNHQHEASYRNVCAKCGATRQDSQLGLEATPEEYVANLVAVFAEVKRVLRDDGTLWLNLGDSYIAQGGRGEARMVELGRPSANAITDPRARGSSSGSRRGGGLKPKDLVGIPWRVAFALQADGWYLRSDIIWAKPNPMPESVTDRPTKSHEYLFLLTKSPRYYFDQEAVREGYQRDYDSRTWEERKALGQTSGNREPDRMTLTKHVGHDLGGNGAGRNLRSVWTIATRPYPGAHFAVFPPELPERCIKAGSAEGGVVLDPFAGSGTVGLVANRLSRRAILIDLNPAYIEQQMKRNAQVPVGL